jgi:hypothetical protein
VQRVHGGALGRSRVAHSYADRQTQEVDGKRAVARGAVSLLRGGEVAILDGGSTALALVDEIPAGHTGTFVTHSPPVAAGLARHPGIEVVVVGGSLDARAMTCVGASSSSRPERARSSASRMRRCAALEQASSRERRVAAVGAPAAPRASAVPGAETLRTSSAFRNTFRGQPEGVVRLTRAM